MSSFQLPAAGRRIVRFGGSMAALAVAGCVSTPPAEIAPAESYVRTRDFSGTYVLADVRSGGPDHGAGRHATLVPVGRLQPGSAVLVTHRPGLLSFTYRLRTGRTITRFLDPDAAPAAWHGNQLVFAWRAQVLPTSVLSSESTIGTLTGNRLVLTSSGSETGLYLVVPLHAKNTTVATLSRVAQEDPGLGQAFEAALEVRARAMAGNAEAQITMARSFLTESDKFFGVQDTWERAQGVAWLERAANQNNLEAQFGMGMVLSGVYDHDGVTWLRRAAERGHLEATYQLGQRLLSAGSFYRKPEEALTWLRLAGHAGYLPAQRSLGMLLSRGNVPHDPVEACFWYQLGAATGDMQCKSQAAKLSAELTPEQRTAVETRVREWRPKALVAMAREQGATEKLQ